MIVHLLCHSIHSSNMSTMNFSVSGAIIEVLQQPAAHELSGLLFNFPNLLIYSHMAL